MTRYWTVSALIFLAACGRPTVVEGPRPDPGPAPPPAIAVWTAGPDVVLSGDGASAVLPLPFTRLEALGVDSLGLLVRCGLCPGDPQGRVAESDVIYRTTSPEAAAHGTLAEFALAIRGAAIDRDLEALLPVMADDFSYSFVGPQSPASAFAVWRAEDFATLDRLPELLDRGLTPVDARIWAAPPEYAEETGFRQLRSGFRQRQDGRWEWVFLIRGVVD